MPARLHALALRGLFAAIVCSSTVLMANPAVVERSCLWSKMWNFSPSRRK